MIPFNKPPLTGSEQQHILDSIQSAKISGDGPYTKKCHNWFKEELGSKCLLTTSCTHALEMSAILIDIEKDDEVIMPSYTFVSTANAFVLRGAKVVFVDIRPDTMNIDETKIEAAITSKTKAIVPVHYAGVACEMDTIMEIATRHNLYVIEDAAQGMMSNYKGKPLGTIGHMGTFSFHETKNYTSAGEGGLLIINDTKFEQRAEIIREKGTNRSQFFRGMIDKYSWVDLGSSYLMNDVSAAYLWGQLEKSKNINTRRLHIWNKYYEAFKGLQNKKLLKLPVIPTGCQHNAHMFYIKLKNITERTEFIKYLSLHQIMAVFHYIPLHSAQAGEKFGKFNQTDIYTTSESEKLVRLPIFYNLTDNEINHIIITVKKFFKDS